MVWNIVPVGSIPTNNNKSIVFLLFHFVFFYPTSFPFVLFHFFSSHRFLSFRFISTSFSFVPFHFLSFILFLSSHFVPFRPFRPILFHLSYYISFHFVAFHFLLFYFV